MTTLSIKLTQQLQDAFSASGFESEEAFLEHAIELAKSQAAEEQAVLQELGDRLAPGMTAAESAFSPLSTSEIMARAKMEHAG